MSEAPKRIWADMRLEADTLDPEDVILTVDSEFAANVGSRIQEAGAVFDIDTDLANEIVRRWNRLAAVEAERDKLGDAVREAEVAFGLYAEYTATAADRGGRHGPKGRAARRWEDAVAAWLAKHGGTK